MQSSNIPKYVPWGEDPEEGMILMGFSCGAVLEGRELKEKIISKIREGELGFRSAVKMFQEEAGADFDQALDMVKRIRRDLKTRNKRDSSLVISTPYKYTINKVFWAFEFDLPQNDPRYFKLDVIDCKNIDIEKYENEDKSFNSEKFIKEHVSDREKKEFFEINERAPEDKSGDIVDGNWLKSRK